MKEIELIQIGRAGEPERVIDPFPEMLREVCADTAAFYGRVGFEPPWISYVSVYNGKPVGGGGFKGAPANGKVEIAYFTLPELEGQGYATATARALTALARDASPDVTVMARTLPEKNASNALLQKLGFAFAGDVDDPEDGPVWEWHAPPPPQARPMPGAQT